MRIAVAGGSGVAGSYAVRAASAAGHEAVVVSRAVGVDTRSGEGLAAALAGVDVVIDATNAGTTDEALAREFFVASTNNLASLGERSGVRHLVVLSIVGIDAAGGGYYAAKLAHERAALEGPLPATVVRTTQFHEFPAQMIGRQRRPVRLGDVLVQTVAARTVGEILLETAEFPPGERARDVAGPRPERLVALARHFARQFDWDVEIEPVESDGPETGLLPSDDARRVGPSFAEWLASDDAARMAARH